MSSPKKPSKKIIRTATEYVHAHAAFCAYDCSDGMHEAEQCEHTFDVLCEDTQWDGMDIQSFINIYIPEEIEKAKAEIVENYGEEIDWNDTPSEFMGRIK